MSDIHVEGLCKAYGGNQVIRNFSAVFPEGQCSALMGRSGCGKTTFLQILMGFLKADSGKISGVPEKMAVVFQEDRLCEDFDAVTNVQIAAAPDIHAENIRRALEEIGLAGVSIRVPVRELSGGMKRRVAIVRALLAEADLVLLDEPFKGLDAETKDIVMKYFTRTLSGRTAILVTHDEGEARQLCTHIVRMSPDPLD